MVLAWDKLGLLLDEPVLGAELQNFPRTQLDKEKSVRVIGAIIFPFHFDVSCACFSCSHVV